MDILRLDDPLKNIVIDTSALMQYSDLIYELIDMYNIYIHICVIEELDNLKQSTNYDIAFKARMAIKQLEKYKKYVNFIFDKKIDEKLATGLHKDYNYNDNVIVSCCKDISALLLTEDLNLKIKAESIQIQVLHLVQSNIEYIGYKEVKLNDNEIAFLYENLNTNIYENLINEYLVVRNSNNEIIDKLKWDGLKYSKINYKKVKSDFMLKIEPRNLQQELAFDMLQNLDITIKLLTGKFGSGKDFLMISNALSLIKSGKYSKIMWVRNNIEVKNSKPIGFLPNGKADKLLPFAMIMADHVGGVDGLSMLIDSNILEIEHFGFIRGRDLKNTLVLVSEAENMTKEHIQLLISRIGENSSLWLNGDFKQVDDDIFKKNSGLSSMINKLKGHPKFGFVKFSKTERSETADMADLLD